MGFEFTTPAIEKWQLDEFMSVIDEFEDAVADTVNHKFYTGNSYQMILLHIIGKVLLTSREVLSLCALGYPDGALSLARNIYEQMVIVSFFELHRNDAEFQSYVDDFFLSYEMQRNKMLQVCETHFPEGEMENLRIEKEKIKTKTKRNIHKDYGWSGLDNFAHLAESIINHEQDEDWHRFLGTQYIRYKRACLSLHAGCMGNMMRIGHDTGYGKVDTSPTLYGQSTPLVYMASSLILIVGVSCREFELDSKKNLERLNRLAITYQSQEECDVEAL